MYSDLGLNLSTVIHKGPPVLRLGNQVIKGLPDLYNIMEVLI